MRLFFNWLAGGAVLALVCAGLAVFLALDRGPDFVRDTQMSPSDVARARRWAAESDPRRSKPGVPRVLVGSAHDLDLLIHDGSRRLLKGSGRLTMSEARAEALVCAPVPRLPGHWWMNWRIEFEEAPHGAPDVTGIHMGGVRIPSALAGFALRRMLAFYGLEGEWRQALGMVQNVAMSPTGLRVSYLWQPEFEDRLREGLVPGPMQAQLRVYSERLAEVVRPKPELVEGRPVSLAVVIPPLFELAHQRTAAYALHPDGPDASAIQAQAASENRAALITLALYAAQRPMTKLVPAARHWTLPASRQVLIGGREDHPQHMLISAVLAAEGGGRLADAIGVYKEISDSKDGSGFSFDDLAADRAGARMGQRAVHDPLALQNSLGQVTAEADFMPSVSGLPSFLPEAEFRARFGRIGSPAYSQFADEIERRIQHLAVNR